MLKLNLEAMARKLYDPDNLGGISIPNFLEEERRIAILDGIKGADLSWRRPQRREGYVFQEMDIYYFQEGFQDYWEERGVPEIEELKREFEEEFYKPLGKVAGFDGKINFTGLNHYQNGSIGITPHRDYEGDINLVSIFVLQGEAPFYVCSDRKKSNSLKLNSEPGSLILLRAARKEEEQSLRAWHYLEEVKSERYVLIFRQIESSGPDFTPVN